MTTYRVGNHQPCLPITSAHAGCGYCDGSLTLQPAADWACEHCKPLLAAVRGEGDWILMHRRARRAKTGRAMP